MEIIVCFLKLLMVSVVCDVVSKQSKGMTNPGMLVLSVNHRLFLVLVNTQRLWYEVVVSKRGTRLSMTER